MRFHALVTAVVLLSACRPGVYGPFVVLDDPVRYGVNAPVHSWYNARDLRQLEYIAALIEAGNQTGVRCPGRVTVGEIRYALLARINSGRAQANDLVYSHFHEIMSERGCVRVEG